MTLKQHLIRVGLIWVGLIALIYAFAAAGIRMVLLSRDPAQTEDFPIYIGLISNLGALMWCASGTVSLFTWGVLRRDPARTEHSSFARYLGCMTLFLLADDFWLLHEVVFPTYIGGPQDLLMGLYPVLIVWLFYRYRALLVAETQYVLLLVGIGLLGLSMVIDVVPSPVGTDIEDAVKVLGIATYTYYCFLTMGQLASSASSKE